MTSGSLEVEDLTEEVPTIHHSSSSSGSSDNNDSNSAVHFLPCSILYDGPTLITPFFKVKDDEERPKLKRAHFRGRKLLGTEVSPPKGASIELESAFVRKFNCTPC
jgi:hypothetical protein